MAKRNKTPRARTGDAGDNPIQEPSERADAPIDKRGAGGSRRADKRRAASKVWDLDCEPEADPSGKPTVVKEGGAPARPVEDGPPGEEQPREAAAAPGDPMETADEESSTPAASKGETRSRTDSEVLERLLEKNEIILKLNKENQEKDRQLKDLNEKWLRSVAEFENYRKRSRKEWELLKQQSRTEVIVEILNVVDDFERALSAVEESATGEFEDGINLIYNKLCQSLKQFGVSEIQALHAPFDPRYHMAVSQIEVDKVEPGLVADVIQKGYQLDGTVIRPARVIVAK